MPLYDKPVRSLMKEMAGELAPETSSVFTRKDALRWFQANYPKIKPGTITAHLTRLSINATSRSHYNAKPGEDDVFFQIDSSHFRLYQPSNDPEPIRETRRGNSGNEEDDDTVDIDESESMAGATEFAYEADLKNYLSKNLSALEPGLRLYEDEDI
ncbi:MAG: DUF91 domain-containing protein, partial [Verrucomicrobiota bacterium]